MENDIIDFFKKNPNPDDNKIHKLANKLDMSPHDLETKIYAMLSNYINTKNKLVGGKGDNLSPDDFDPDEIAMGLQVEMEHTTDPDVAMEITLDHLAENPKYYSLLKKSGIDPHESHIKASSLNQLLDMCETGEPDQDYDHKYYTAICKHIAKQTGFRCTHREFDKYQGVFLYVTSRKGSVEVMPAQNPDEGIEEGWWIDGSPENEIYEIIIDKNHNVLDSGLADALKSYFKTKGRSVRK